MATLPCPEVTPISHIAAPISLPYWTPALLWQKSKASSCPFAPKSGMGKEPSKCSWDCFPKASKPQQGEGGGGVSHRLQSHTTWILVLALLLLSGVILSR